MPDIALAPDINGVCNVDGTLVISSTPKKIDRTKMKYYQNHIDKLLSDDKINHYIICQIDTIFELFMNYIPIHKID